MVDALLAMARAIAEGRKPDVRGLAERVFLGGATRADARTWFLEAIGHYVYAADTLLHVAAAAYDLGVARALIGSGAKVRARNRRGAEPLHYAADGNPLARTWNPAAQTAIVAFLIEAGADPNALDASGVAPLHRAVRTRCTGAVRSLLAGGAKARLPNKHGSTPLILAKGTSGRGGTGSAESKRAQAEIVALLEAHG